MILSEGPKTLTRSRDRNIEIKWDVETFAREPYHPQLVESSTRVGEELEKMSPKLKIRLRPGWQPADNPTIPTYRRSASYDSGLLQFSIAQFRHGTAPNATEQTLVTMCEQLTSSVRGRRDASRASGACEFGTYGTMAVQGDAPVRFQAWVVSNGTEFILVTHTCGSDPDPEEVREANEIALMTGFD